MKYSLRSLVIATIVAPPVLAGGYGAWQFLSFDDEGTLCLLAGLFLVVAIPSVVWMLIPVRS